jgi:hypothetical protein
LPLHGWAAEGKRNGYLFQRPLAPQGCFKHQEVGLEGVQFTRAVLSTISVIGFGKSRRVGGPVPRREGCR